MSKTSKMWIAIIVAIIVVAIGWSFFSNSNGGNKTPITTSIPSENMVSKCNFTVTSPTIFSKVSIPLTIKGILDKADTTKGCMWNEGSLRAGEAELFYNKNGEGWKSAGTSVPIIITSVPGASTTTLAFSASFGLYTKALGLASNTPLKIMFTELNIPPQPNPNTFDFLVSLK